mgnify:CR=1 FL=1
MEILFRSEKKSLYFGLMLTVLVIISFLALSALRIYTLRLDYKLHKMNLQIQNIEMEEKENAQYLSYLVSPNRILKISKEIIGMNSVELYKVIHIAEINMKYVNNYNINKENHVNIFLTKAYAK